MKRWLQKTTLLIALLGFLAPIPGLESGHLAYGTSAEYSQSYVLIELYTDPSRCPACAELERLINRGDVDFSGVYVNRYSTGSPSGYIPTVVVKIVRNGSSYTVGSPIVGVDPAAINGRIASAKNQL